MNERCKALRIRYRHMYSQLFISLNELLLQYSEKLYSREYLFPFAYTHENAALSRHEPFRVDAP